MHFTALSCCSALHHSVIDSITHICIHINTSVDIYSCAECECSCCECNEWQMANTTAQANASSLSYTDTDIHTHTHTRPLELLYFCHDAKTYHATNKAQMPHPCIHPYICTHGVNKPPVQFCKYLGTRNCAQLINASAQRTAQISPTTHNHAAVLVLGAGSGVLLL